jgi:hypothetical protein
MMSMRSRGARPGWWGGGRSLFGCLADWSFPCSFHGYTGKKGPPVCCVAWSSPYDMSPETRIDA